MLILPNSCFLHVPKTGGSWVKKAIIASGIEYEEYSVNSDPHIGVKQCPASEKYKFAFVRHPLSIYRSFWQFSMTTGWDENNIIDIEYKSDNFHTFIENVLQKFSGFYGNGLSEFLGDEDSEIEFIWRYENLVEDLILALNSAGETFDENAIRNLKPYNVSNKKKYPAEYTEALESAVRKAEAMVFDRFNYD